MHLLTFSHFDSLPVSVRPLQSFGCEGDGGEGLGGGGEGESEGEGEGEGGPQQVFLQFFFCFFFLHLFVHFLWLLRSSFLHAFFSFVHGFLSLRSSQLFGSALETAASVAAREGDVIVGTTTASASGGVGAGGGAASVEAGDGIGDRAGATTAFTLAGTSIEMRSSINFMCISAHQGDGGMPVRAASFRAGASGWCIKYAVEAQLRGHGAPFRVEEAAPSSLQS